MGVLKAEVELNVPASKAWEIYRSNSLMQSVNPDLISSVRYVRGNGSPGSIRLLKVGPKGLTYVKESKEEIEEVVEGKDEKKLTYKVLDGEIAKMYNPYRVTFSFIPLKNDHSKCLASWKACYETTNPNISPPHKAKNAATIFLNSVQDFYLKSKPSLPMAYTN